MCGIFGFIRNNNESFKKSEVIELSTSLLKQSMSRGKDASGISVLTNDSIYVLKRPLKADHLIKTQEFKDLLSLENISACIGHARMETNGSLTDNHNNQPVIKDGIVAIHNGIIVNVDELWKKNSKITRKFDVDTEVFNSLLDYYCQKSTNIDKAVEMTLKQLSGSYSIASVFEKYNCLLLASNTGSLYYVENEEYIVFASEKLFLDTLQTQGHIPSLTVHRIEPGTYKLVNMLALNKKNEPLDS